MLTRLSLLDDGSLLAELQVKPVWVEQIRSKQLVDETLGARFKQVESGETSDFGINSEGVLCFCGRMCIPKDDDLRQSILREAHSGLYAMHPGGNKMYQNLWLLQPVKISLWKWERIIMDFVSGLPLTPTRKDSIWVIVDRLTKSVHFVPVHTDYSLQKLASYQASIGMVPYEALYGRRCRTPTCWTELGERRVLGLELVTDTEDKVKLIRDRLKEAVDRQKSYADLKRHEIEYAVEDLVFLKVSTWKKVLRFGRKGKLSPRFIGPYQVVRQIGPVAYQLELPPNLSQIHDVFHVSMLRRYHSDPSHVVAVEEIELIKTLLTLIRPNKVDIFYSNLVIDEAMIEKFLTK
ncbi:uncharacterized protein [Gossypium hirsutum]|uniref:Tf2-1-like SH3-like domain-containing protein n=1 Tax=Gossypium hirsutum TaxID=3635 RepID=A0ABM2ZB20_GOSHI|nr:uncharacterized protein LOC121211293 [Gossypium hirsutum]